MTAEKKGEGPVRVIKGSCWSYIEIAGISVGCEHCEVETPKADRALGPVADRINAALAKDYVPKDVADKMAEALNIVVRDCEAGFWTADDMKRMTETRLFSFAQKALKAYADYEVGR